jgi:4-aminobutyrate aminotransferase-like enzyme
MTPSSHRSKTVPPPHVKLLVPPDGFSGNYKYTDASRGEKYAATVDGQIRALTDEGFGLSCVMIDPCFMSNGVLEAPAGYLPQVCERVRSAGGLYIADEVQSGFGRTGGAMWGHQHYNVIPDMVTIGKPAGNGHPIGAIICRHELVYVVL